MNELGAPGRQFDNRCSPPIRPPQVALPHAEDQRSQVGAMSHAMSQQIGNVKLTCYEDQEISPEVVELICYIATGTLIWYMASYQNDISSEGLRSGDPDTSFFRNPRKAARVRTLQE